MNSSGFTKRELVVIGFAILIVCILVLASNALHFGRRDGRDFGNNLGNNLRVIEGAKEQWALENRKMPEDKVSLTDLTAYFKNNRTPVSVLGETYVVTTVGGLAQAITKGELNGRRGPFTVTSF